ncbi:hypothetical protein Scep_017067 [Stephania cephalantha]|uniref:Uncharacterized protein n=1 Tax=Stephania cephalantha TaxID=152367 RepID=A0AAP0NUQ1_9MAGN
MRRTHIAIPRSICWQLKHEKTGFAAVRLYSQTWQHGIGEELMEALTWQILIGAKCNCDVMCTMIRYMENADWKKAGRMTRLSNGRVTCGVLLGLLSHFLPTARHVSRGKLSGV